MQQRTLKNLGLFLGVTTLVACASGEGERGTPPGNPTTVGPSPGNPTSGNPTSSGPTPGGPSPGPSTPSDPMPNPTSPASTMDPNTAPPDGTPVALHGQLSVNGAQLVDANGTAIQLKGPSSMWLNWETSGFAASSGALTTFRDDWGATLIRAAMGIEPSGAYLSNPAGAERDLRDVVDNAVAHGLYVIIDWHDHNAHQHVEESVAFFKKMATDYGHLPNVIYEVFNEPEQIDWAVDLKPYHERLVAEIRAIDPDNVIILGTTTWSQDVDIAAADPVAGTNLMYTFHFYSCTHTDVLRDRVASVVAEGLPVFVTEWGASHSDGGTPDNPDLCLEEAQLWHDLMNQNLLSWAAWKLDDCVDVTCYFKPGTSIGGSWTDDRLNGHGSFVRDRMRE